MNMEAEEFQQNWIELLNRHNLDACKKIVEQSSLAIQTINEARQVFVYVSFDDFERIEDDRSIKDQLLETAKSIAVGHLFSEENEFTRLHYRIKKPEIPQNRK